MSAGFDLVLRRVCLPGGTLADVAISGGRFAAIGAALPRCDNEIDGNGKLLLPGLHDHHIHLLATAARLESVDLADQLSAESVAAALHAKAAILPPGQWLRAIGYDERAGGIPDRQMLDQWIADRPMRIQDRTGALWLLNSAALARLGSPPWPKAVESDPQGAPTGRIWRGDEWLRATIGAEPPSFHPLSLELASHGVTSATDAGANNGPAEAALLSAAVADGSLLQKLTLMGREDLLDGPAYHTGPLKLLYDERDLPDPIVIAARIETARKQARAVAAHCVTEAELVVYLAALDLAGGALPGDRIEHGSMIPKGLIADVAASGLIVVANPGFIARRGDRYLAEIEPHALPDLQRLGSLAAAGVKLLAGSDAPYGPSNLWAAMRTAVHRLTPSRQLLGPSEAIDPSAALTLFAGSNRIESGAVADCCLVDRDWEQQLGRSIDPSPVCLTLINGAPVYSRGR